MNAQWQGRSSYLFSYLAIISPLKMAGVMLVLFNQPEL